ncbi:L domain-like protein [Piromyces finnis]|uniref:L domain-like protein n=1 Tax=Piromyces finnis TaxID=1754191 RepID=A0A1Y1VJU1_9FUNG|nr:L domain-like protein [Piromyces finnis]|eukprot:ORX58360.1 L domain-like protein [Piromyces finnis]
MKVKAITFIITLANVLPTFGVIQECVDFGKFLQRSSFTFNSKEDCCGLKETEQYSFNITCKDEHIKTIDLQLYSKFVFSDTGSFPLLSELTELKINGENNFPNGILPKRFFDLPKLKILNLYKTPKMPENANDINGNSPIEEIYLDNNGLVKFPYIFKKLKNLKTLSIKGNQITGNLTSEIKEFKTLKQLYIQNNQFNGELIIPDSLTTINIVGNKFTSYSSTNKNNALEEVYANGSSIINDSFINKLATYDNIKKMYLSSGSITKLPNKMFNLTNMEALYVIIY